MRTVIVLLGLLTLALPALAEDAPIPRLGEHRFVPVLDLEEPFITTHIQNTVSLGKAIGAQVPVFDVTDSTIIGSAEADIFLAGLGFRYQHAAKDWLAVKISMATVARVGTSTPSLLADGITAAVGYDLGWLMRVYQSRTVVVSGSLGLGNRSSTFLNLLDWAQGIVEGTNVPLVRSRSALRGQGGVHAAWGLSRRFGLLGAFNLNYGESFDGIGKNGWNTDARLALSYDVEQDLKIPLGLAATVGRYEVNESSNPTSMIWFWSLRFAVQSRADFTFGLDLKSSYLTSSVDDSDIQLTQMSIDMRYYF